MLIKKDQQLIFDALNSLGALREDQALTILQSRYPEFSLERTVTPLIVGGKVKRRENMLALSNCGFENKRTQAIDIMLAMKADLEQPFFSAQKPFDLTFFKTLNGKLWRYDVCTVNPGCETAVCAMLEGIELKSRKMVLIITDKEQMEKIWIPCEHCFAIRQKDNYEFYKVKE